MKKWEFTVSVSFEGVNKLGRDGWELVFIRETSLQSQLVWYYLKRELPQEERRNNK